MLKIRESVSRSVVSKSRPSVPLPARDTYLLLTVSSQTWDQLLIEIHDFNGIRNCWGQVLTSEPCLYLARVPCSDHLPCASDALISILAHHQSHLWSFNIQALTRPSEAVA